MYKVNRECAKNRDILSDFNVVFRLFFFFLRRCRISEAIHNGSSGKQRVFYPVPFLVP